MNAATEKMIADLDDLFASSLALPEICGRAKSCLIAGIPAVISEAAADRDSLDAVPPGASPRFSHEGVLFELRVSEPANDPSTLDLAVGEASTK